MKVHPLLPGALTLAFLTTSCATGPRPPEPGTPAFFWGAAQQTFKSGDLLKTNDDLLEILQGENDFTARARVWQIALSAGIVRGADELAAAYEAGARMNRANPGPFRKNVTQLRTLAGHSALDFAQQVHNMAAKEKGPQIALEFPFPPGSAVEPPALRKVYAGVVSQESEAANLEIAMLQRGVVQVVCKLTGNPDDPAKSLDLFKTIPVQVKRETFFFAAAQILYDESQVFGSMKLDQPLRLKALCDQALEALGAIPESKDTKALAEKIQATLKKLHITA
jgi:hypothetical protein